MPRPNPGRTPVFHIIPIEKLASVVEHGLLCNTQADQRFGAQDLAEAAHTSIKEARRRRTVQLAQGGIMADYVPFYFGPRSPMLYSIMCGNTEYGRAGRGQVGMVHLVFHMEVLARDFHGRWCFIDGHLTRAWAQFGATMDELDERVDFDVMRARWWHEPDEMRSARQAEFLVHDAVPWEYVALVVVMNDGVADEVEELLANVGADHTPKVIACSPGRSGSVWPHGYYYEEGPT
ncbi:toxin-antitoxin system toxin DarT [soil metagenome]